MATDNVKDYLGHECLTTRAFERFGDNADEARVDAATDPRRTARQLGINLVNTDDRLTRLAQMLKVCEDLVKSGTDSDEVEAVLAAAHEYAWETGRHFERVAGVSLVAIEQGGLWKPATAKEVSHV